MAKAFNFESEFTRAEYERFVAAVEKRESYSFYVGKAKDKIRAVVYGTPCGNGRWLPENYYWSISIYDCRNGYSGSGSPFRVKELKTYEDIVYFVYDSLKLPRPKSLPHQLSFL
jgi:hypothetical protein